MRWYHGKKRVVCKTFNLQFRRVMAWAVNVKPGDYISTCQGCNRKVELVRLLRVNIGRRTRVAIDADFVDTHGCHHDPVTCAGPPWTVAQVISNFRSYKQLRDFPDDNLRRIHERLDAGLPIVDEYGELLPELDRHIAAYIAPASRPAGV